MWHYWVLCRFWLWPSLSVSERRWVILICNSPEASLWRLAWLPLASSCAQKTRYSAFTSQPGFVVCTSTFYEANSACGGILNLGQSPEWEGATVLYLVPLDNAKDPLKNSLLFNSCVLSEVLFITSFIHPSHKYLLNVYYAMDML